MKYLFSFFDKNGSGAIPFSRFAREIMRGTTMSTRNTMDKGVGHWQRTLSEALARNSVRVAAALGSTSGSVSGIVSQAELRRVLQLLEVIFLSD
jgi:hypothetical protein